MMLAIDTSGPWISCAWGDAARVTARHVEASRLRHNERLGPVCRSLLTEAARAPRWIAVNTGPGSFTGTRVGVSMAMGLAQAHAIPVVPVSLLEVVAETAVNEYARLAVAFPVVAGQWCRAVMNRRGTGWEEESVEELRTEDLESVTRDLPHYVPWGVLPGATPVPGTWCPAEILWGIAWRHREHRSVAPDRLAARYIGPSQAERKFRERRDGNPPASA